MTKKEETWQGLIQTDPRIAQDAIRVLENDFNEVLKEEILKEINEKGLVSWIDKYHFGWGLYVRNLLRDRVCFDDKLPVGNWDAYYCLAIEFAVGARSENDESDKLSS